MFDSHWLALLRRPRDWLRRRPGALSHHGALARKALAASLLVTAALLAFAPVDAGAARASPVVVTARDIATGTTLSPGDVALARLPPAAVPSGALTSTTAAVGAVLAGSARAGEPLTDARLVSGYSSPRADDETATVPIRLSDPAIAGLLRPGTRVDVVTADDTADEGRVLASDATVVTVTRDPPHAVAAAGPLVLIALPADTATTVAAVSLRQPVTVTLR